MVKGAEAAGLLQPGGTIMEGTSGTTGMGLALTAIAKGCKTIFVLSNKQSQEKQDILRAVGAELVSCPVAVAPTTRATYDSISPESWTSTRAKLRTPEQLRKDDTMGSMLPDHDPRYLVKIYSDD